MRCRDALSRVPFDRCGQAAFACTHVLRPPKGPHLLPESLWVPCSDIGNSLLLLLGRSMLLILHWIPSLIAMQLPLDSSTHACAPAAWSCADACSLGGCSCYASPIRRAARFAEIMWEGRETPLVHTDSLKEAYLGWLQGVKQGAQPCRPGSEP